MVTLSCNKPENGLVKAVENGEVLSQISISGAHPHGLFGEHLILWDDPEAQSFIKATSPSGSVRYLDWSGEVIEQTPGWNYEALYYLVSVNSYPGTEQEVNYFITEGMPEDATLDTRLRVVVPDKSCDVMYVKDDLYILVGDGNFYDLNGQLLHKAGSGWWVNSISELENGHLAVNLSDGDREDSMTKTIEVPMPTIGLAQSKYTYRWEMGYQFYPQIETEELNGHAVVDLGLSAKWLAEDYYDETFDWFSEAYTQWGDTFCFPSAKEVKELIRNCQWIPIDNKYLLISKKNGNNLLLPARKGYWTSTLVKNPQIKSKDYGQENYDPADALEAISLRFDGGKPHLEQASRKDSLCVRLVTY